MSEHRVLRVPLPLQLIREIDEIIDHHLGGYTSRAEFVRDAVEAMALEVRFGVASGEEDDETAAAETTAVAPLSERMESREPTRFETTALALDEPGAMARAGEAEVRDEALFGLHNRDYPSLWAASRLASLTRQDFVPFDEFRAAVAAEAWEFGEHLRGLEGATGQKKLTALFPTNRSKPESSEGAFLAFAVGTYTANDAALRASGPLFTWRICQLVRRNGKALAGLTPEGYALLESLQGITVETPHPPELALRFFDHLRRYAPADWGGFEELLRALERRLTRAELVEVFRQRHPDWTENVAATNAAGYVARAREWGLVAPKLAESRYVLTEFGRSQVSSRKEEGS